MTKTDVIIIGAGPVGLFAVHQLGIKGLKAVVIDVSALCINNNVMPDPLSLMESIFYSHTFSKTKKLSQACRKATVAKIIELIKNNRRPQQQNYRDHNGGGGSYDDESSFAPSSDYSDSES